MTNTRVQVLWCFIPQGASPGALTLEAWQQLIQAKHVLLVLDDPCTQVESWEVDIPQPGSVITVLPGNIPNVINKIENWVDQNVPLGTQTHPEFQVVFVGSQAAQQRTVAQLTDQTGIGCHVYHGLHSTHGTALVDFVDVMERMADDGGCPWVQQQTHESLRKFALEETYELLEAIDSNDVTLLQEELGDVLFQVVFHACVASRNPQRRESDRFSIDDVATTIGEKLRRRRPHVFGTEKQRAHGEAGHDLVATGVQWHAAKQAEKAARESCADGVPLALPALARAEKILDRANRAGLIDHALAADTAPTTEPASSSDGGSVAAVAATAAQITAGKANESQAATSQAADGRAGDAVGDALLRLVNQLRVDGIDAESELRAAVTRAEHRLRAAEQQTT